MSSSCVHFSARIPLILLAQTILLWAAAVPLTAEPAQAPKEKQHPAEILLWPNGAPGSESRRSEKEEYSWRSEPDITFVVTSNIHEPSLVPYLPEKQKANGAAVIIAPGGGHMFLTMDREGYDFAEWLVARGYAAFVLKYRLARDRSNPETSTQPYSVERHARADALRAVQFVRSRAHEWNINPGKIGLVGFSAGGEVALLASTSHHSSTGSAEDQIAAVDARPDFLALLYPGGLQRPEMQALAERCPPVFLLCAYDDRMPTELTQFFVRLREANVNSELHIYNSGGHGFGVRDLNFAVSRWPDRFVEWLKDRRVVQ